LNRSAGEGISEELRAAEVRFTRFFNNTPIAIASFAEDGSMVQSNAPFQRLFAPVLAAAKRHQKDGITIDQLCGENERDALLLAMQAANDGKGEIAHVDSTLPALVSDLTGEEASVRYLLSAVADGELAEEVDGKKSERAILYAIDMTEQKELERQMAQTQKMTAVGQLAGGIAHDFNNVLTAIIGFSDLLLANHRPSDPSFPDIMQIKQNANRAAVLVRQLLAFSRRQTLRPQTLSVPDVLSDLRLLLERLVGDKIKLDMKHGRDLWNLKADIGQFEQVIVNLCVNARDAINDTPKGHSGGGGVVTVSTRNMLANEVQPGAFNKELPAADYVVIEVSDTGTGMSPELMQKIFDPFFSTKDVGKGTGLGLSTVYGIIKQSEGYICPISTVGKGTTFQIYLPAMRADEIPEPEIVAPEELVIAAAPVDISGRGRILLVEDEDGVRSIAASQLKSRGYDVEEACDGEEAMEILEDNPGGFDLIVSDVVMPGMDGPTLIREAKHLLGTAKVLFMSGYAEEQLRKDIDIPDMHFIAKPFSVSAIGDKVASVMHASKQSAATFTD